jgi:hypothetical protein
MWRLISKMSSVASGAAASCWEYNTSVVYVGLSSILLP